MSRHNIMRSFAILWLGQIVSLIGSAMTWFAFTIWAWETTGKASALATISFFAFLPTVLFSPVAGAFVDRLNRKIVMLLSDLATAIGTLTVFLIYTFGDLQIWHVYVVSILAGFFTAFQYSAYAAAVTTMLPKEDYARAEGMLGSGIITHSMWVAAEYANRTIVMKDGCILSDGPTRVVFAEENRLAEASLCPPSLVRLSNWLGTESLTVEEMVKELKGQG